jgi:hypothetical protein
VILPGADSVAGLIGSSFAAFSALTASAAMTKISGNELVPRLRQFHFANSCKFFGFVAVNQRQFLLLGNALWPVMGAHRNGWFHFQLSLRQQIEQHQRWLSLHRGESLRASE